MILFICQTSLSLLLEVLSAVLYDLWKKVLYDLLKVNEQNKSYAVRKKLYYYNKETHIVCKKVDKQDFAYNLQFLQIVEVPNLFRNLDNMWSNKHFLPLRHIISYF